MGTVNIWILSGTDAMLIAGDKQNLVGGKRCSSFGCYTSLYENAASSCVGVRTGGQVDGPSQHLYQNTISRTSSCRQISTTNRFPRCDFLLVFLGDLKCMWNCCRVLNTHDGHSQSLLHVNMTSSTKPEVHNVLQQLKRRIEPPRSCIRMLW